MSEPRALSDPPFTYRTLHISGIPLELVIGLYDLVPQTNTYSNKHYRTTPIPYTTRTTKHTMLSDHKNIFFVVCFSADSILQCNR